jgi:hypothetical protein
MAVPTLAKVSFDAVELTNGAVTQLTFNATEFDSGSFVSGDTFVAPSDGYYHIGFRAGLSETMNGKYWRIFIYKNGAALTSPIYTSGGNDWVANSVAVDTWLDASDIITFYVQHNYGANGTLWAGSYTTHAYIYQLDDYPGTFSSARVYLTSDEILAASTPEELVWDAESWDTDGYWTSGTDLVVPSTGIYLVVATVAMTSVVDDVVLMASTSVNGSQFSGAFNNWNHENQEPPDNQMETVLLLTASDTVSLTLEQRELNDRSVESGAVSGTALTIVRLGDQS